MGKLACPTNAWSAARVGATLRHAVATGRGAAEVPQLCVDLRQLHANNDGADQAEHADHADNDRDFERPVGTYLYGRRLYEEMTGWETADAQPGQPPLMLDFARIWQAAGKVVYSRTLDRVSTARKRIERHFDPEAVRQMKAQADRDITVGGPELAAHAIRAGLVDDYHLLISPVVLGSGKAALPGDVRLPLDLVDERRFGNGVVHLHYRGR